MLPLELDAITKANVAYQERNRLVAALSYFYPSHLMPHPADDASWENDWRNIVCIHGPEGQMAWHIHDSELPWFTHLEKTENHWDGHTTEMKYERLLLCQGRKAGSDAR